MPARANFLPGRPTACDGFAGRREDFADEPSGLEKAGGAADFAC